MSYRYKKNLKKGYSDGFKITLTEQRINYQSVDITSNWVDSYPKTERKLIDMFNSPWNTIRAHWFHTPKYDKVGFQTYKVQSTFFANGFRCI